MYLTYSEIGFFAIALLGAGACFGVLVMALMAMANIRDEKYDDEPESYGYVQQDETIYPGKDAWKHAVPKVPHAE